MNSRAFSLIEMMVVLLILAISAAAVSLRLQGPLGQARMNDVLGQVVQFDRLSRAYARSQDSPVHLVVDLNTGMLTRTDEGENKPLGAAMELPSQYRIARVILADQDLAWGQAILRCSSKGFTPTYAIEIEETSGAHQKRWVVFAGLSGQAMEPKDDAEVSAIFATALGRDAR